MTIILSEDPRAVSDRDVKALTVGLDFDRFREIEIKLSVHLYDVSVKRGMIEPFFLYQIKAHQPACSNSENPSFSAGEVMGSYAQPESIRPDY